jgi:hypothetical protein
MAELVNNTAIIDNLQKLVNKVFYEFFSEQFDKIHKLEVIDFSDKNFLENRVYVNVYFHSFWDYENIKPLPLKIEIYNIRLLRKISIKINKTLGIRLYILPSKVIDEYKRKEYKLITPPNFKNG